MGLSDYFKTKPITEEEASSLLDSYYEERRWHVETGVPTRQVLEELGLSGAAEDLAREGRLPHD